MWNRNIGFTRWHDRVPELAQALRMMESLPIEQQRVISQVVIQFTTMAGFTTEQEDGLKRLGTERVMGLMKSKTKRRWYDQDGSVHQAFVYLYLMDDAMRREFALKIIISIKALEQFSIWEGAPNTPSVVKGIFNQHLPSLIDKTNWVITEDRAATPPVRPSQDVANDDGNRESALQYEVKRDKLTTFREELVQSLV